MNIGVFNVVVALLLPSAQIYPFGRPPEEIRTFAANTIADKISKE